MAAARLLALAPAPGQQLFLCSATVSAGSCSSSRKTRAVSRHRRLLRSHRFSRPSLSSPSSQTSRSMSTLRTTTRPANWCCCTLPSCASAAAFSHTQTRRPVPSAATRWPPQRTSQLRQPPSSAQFGTATLPKQVAFPRHGKAVAPQQAADETDPDAVGEEADAQQAPAKTPAGPNEKAKAAESTPPTTETKRPARKNSKRTKNKIEAKPSEDAAAPETETAYTEPDSESPSAAPAPTTTTEPAETTQSPGAAESTDVFPPLGPTSAAVDAQKELGQDMDKTSTDAAKSQDPAVLAADASAMAATAAETASIAAGIVSGPSFSTVIELGLPTAGAIAAPGETLSPQDEQQLQLQQQGAPGRITWPTSLRMPLSQKSPPHLAPPLYVHHFDSYSLVKQLEGGGYTQLQAITAMKAVRSLLAQYLDVAQSSLVSKSDVENEAYLFKAACSELSIEVRNNRRRTDEQIRQQRTLLQSEVDIAAQSVNQELVTLTDVVKGLFNDRKMAVREEQKALESAIQQLSYKITIMLNSEMRSEIEGLRWVLIRRSVLGIIFMAILTLGTLRYASYVSHEKQKEAEWVAREARELEAHRFADTKFDTSSPPDAAEILAAN